MIHHPLDGNAIAADEHYNRHEIGTEPGETCGRYHEPDEDAPRGYRPKPCAGVMVSMGDGYTRCDWCDEEANYD